MSQSVDRYLKDKAMDRIDHALGRPLDPTVESYRNCYATDGALADEMAASPFWAEGRRGQSMRYFFVTDEGRAALAQHLKDIGDQHRAFVVTYAGHPRTMIATTRDKARYSRFIEISDVMPDLTFIEFCKRASVSVLHEDAP
ncbi:hypothetical protein ACVMIH_000050 [Bradyrhizobium sp. USDA 4503]